jgi:hypothetical protein
MERRDAQGWGFIGVDQLYQLGEKLVNDTEQRPQPGDIVIAVTHHNPLPIWDLGLEVIKGPPERRKFSFVMDAAGLLGFLSDIGVMVVLHGHTHISSIKVVDGYSGTGAPRFSPMWVLGAGSFAIQRRRTDPAHHFQILEIDKAFYGDPELRYLDVESDRVKPDGEREWAVLKRVGTLPLTSTWDPDLARKALKLRLYDKYRLGLHMDVADSWSVLCAKRLDAGAWKNAFSGICERTTEAAVELGIRDLTTSGIRNILESIFDDPPPEFEICNFRLEQIILKRWMNK